MDSHVLISKLNYVEFPPGKSPTLHREMEEPRFGAHSICPTICCLGPALLCGDQEFPCAAVFGSSNVFGKKQGPLELQVMCYWVGKREKQKSILYQQRQTPPISTATFPFTSSLCLLEHTSSVTVLLAELFPCHNISK